MFQLASAALLALVFAARCGSGRLMGKQPDAISEAVLHDLLELPD